MKIQYTKNEKKVWGTPQRLVDFLGENLPKVQEIHCNEALAEDDAINLCRVLLKNPGKVNVKVLSFRKNELTVNFAEVIARVLSNNSTITKIDLGHNLLGPEGLKALVEPLLGNNKTLKSLLLESNRLSPNSARSLENLLRDNNFLEELNLENNELGARGIKVIAPQVGRKLRILQLAHNGIKSRGVKQLSNSFVGKKEHSLEFLDLTCNQMGPTGMKALSDWLLIHHERQLKKLWLGHNDLGATCGGLLSGIFEYNKTLVEVRLSGNKLGDEGTVALSEGLKKNKSLEVLGLDWNQIKDNGAVALANTLRENLQLRTIDLSGNQIYQRGSIALAQSLPYHLMLKEINMKDNCMDDVAAKAFANSLVDRHCVFERLHWEGNPDISAIGMRTLKNAIHYRNNIRQWFNSKFEKKIQGDKLPKLNWLNKKHISDHEIVKLGCILNENKNIRRLTTIYLGGIEISSRGVESLSEWIGSSECSLKILSFVKNSMGDGGARALAEALETNVSLQDLGVTGSKITSQGARYLGNALEENETLRRLNLSKNQVELDGLLAILGGMQHSKTIEALNVSSNNIQVPRESTLWDTLEASSLQELILRDNKIEDEAVIDIVYSLHRPYRVLDFTENLMTQKGQWVMRSLFESRDINLRY